MFAPLLLKSVFYVAVAAIDVDDDDMHHELQDQNVLVTGISHSNILLHKHFN
jgi:hypothetical protein